MKRKRYTDEQRKEKFAGMGVAEIRRLKQLEDENRKFKQLVIRDDQDGTCQKGTLILW